MVRGCNGSLARQLLIDKAVICRFLWLAAIPAILVAPAVAEAQSSFQTGVGGNGGSNRGDSAYQRMLDEPSLTDQEAQQKREEAAAKVKAQCDAEDRDLQEYYRQQKLDQMNQAKATQGGTRNAIPRRANSVAATTERARLQTVARQIEVARQPNGVRQAPSAAFLEAQARFESKSSALTATIATNAYAAKIQNEAATANQKPLSAEQQELRRRELAEGRRSGRIPDQLTSAEIVAALTRCY